MSNFSIESRTRTPGTEARYEAVTRRLVDEFICQNGDYLDPVSPWLFVNWLIRKKSTISSNTWRNYQAAVIWHLNQQGFESTREAARYLEKQSSEGALKDTGRTSSQKAKEISAEDLREIMSRLVLRRSGYDMFLLHYLRAGIMTGLRECEWKTAELFEDGSGKLLLLVQNGKFSNGRGNGAARTQDITHLEDPFIKSVRRWLRWAQRSSNYEKLLAAMRERLHDITRSLWPGRSKYPSLSSVRHQFAANIKAHGLSREERAALLGHASDSTADCHYGRKSAGWKKLRYNDGREIENFVPRPLAEEVATVRRSGAGKTPAPG